MKITDIHIPNKDCRELKHFPPDSKQFDTLKQTFRKRGIRVPVFVNADGVLLQGHFRLWAWQAIGNKHIPTVVVDSEDDIKEFFL